VTTEQADPLVGTVIAETYRIVGKLGAGGMGSIYEAEHVRMGRRFAMKLLEAALAENEEVFQRFKREAEIAGQLGHPNIFLCHKGRRTDYVKLLDFGISKMKQSGSIVTKTNAVMGTPYYMSPEQAEGRNHEADARTDIFALGAILYEMLTGRLAFYAPSVPTALFKVCYEEPEPIANVVPNLPPGLADVIGKALAKDREARYASARVLGDDLDRIFQGEQAKLETGVAHKVRTAPSLPAPMGPGPTTPTGSASQVMDVQTLPPPARSNTLPILLGIFGVIAVIVAAVLVVFGMRDNKAKGPAPAAGTAAATAAVGAPPAGGPAQPSPGSASRYDASPHRPHGALGGPQPWPAGGCARA